MAQRNTLYHSFNPPELPREKFNRMLLNYSGKLRAVRTQDIKLEIRVGDEIQQSIVPIARIKIPAPEKISSHLIRRFDTNAISASSFFRSAFPNASEEEEAVHMDYLHKIYDTHAAGAIAFGPERRLTGVWVPLEYANEIAEEYGIARFAAPLINYPSPNPSPASPTATKTSAEQDDSSTVQTPKSKQPDQTYATRSSKRPRAAPLSFGSTSPSNFNLSSLHKRSSESVLSSAHHHDHPRPSADSADKPDLSPVDLGASRPQRSSPSKKNIIDESNEFVHEEEHQQQQQLMMGSDEMAFHAKQEALKLVSELKHSQASSARPSTDASGGESKKKSPTKGDTLSRKRSVDEVSASEEADELEEEEEEEEEEQEEQESRGFLPKLLWRRTTPNHPVHPSVKKHKKTAAGKPRVQRPPPAASQPLDPTSSSPLNPNKRNLAIAGIVIAGAAASIVPYFF
ncbi:hypothetical protein PCANC_17391 [Puccinia coronata f. sp. avenae]|uniref:HTH APSES-type domain-containing protein n=1 Tax=Puccinia coronata f. sp. avenae TaxID=200324 RepID=A0A2N5V044_9BASI|nr:hypothetical protein PCANC_17391 [Puccinia coronata f. sp. avenae]